MKEQPHICPLCGRAFSKWFESYTGTLTGSKTYAKRQKDIDQMLERGELLTMEEFFEVWTEWKNTKYHTRKHRGLSDAGEKSRTTRAPSSGSSTTPSACSSPARLGTAA